MSAIFISHSSKNKELAIEVHQQLQANGYHSVFLDVGREDGIIAGEKWEEVLYRELRTCQVLIALVSKEWLASRWCFAELTHAREKGKTVIGLQLSPRVDQSVLSDTQIIRFTPAVRDEGYEHLWPGLRNALDIRGFYSWKEKDERGKTRSPYPGLSPFDQTDAAVFFGRDEAVRKLKEGLLAIRRDPSTNKRFLLVLGASGSGKSSLVRAGVVPLLKHDQDKDYWLVLAPFRPGTRPLNELAKAYAQAFKEPSDNLEWDAVRERFQQALESSNSEILHDLSEDLRMRAQRPQATLLIIIDQVEELLGQDEHGQIAKFFTLLRMLIESHGQGMLVLGTLRSDFLGEFQSRKHAPQIHYQPYPLESAELDFREVIAGPARVAGIKLEDGLVEAMVADTQTKDALPLLAFALRELWVGYGSDKLLTKDEYENGLGRLEGALDKKAEEVYAACSMTSEQKQAFRQSLCKMVRVNDEGRYLRKPLPKARLQDPINKSLERFVSERLLVADTRDEESIYEVTHEALFRGWKRMETWLKADSKFMLWHQQLRGDVKKWESKERDDSALLRGHLLADAERWLSERPDDLESVERDFIAASVNLRDRERIARERLRKRITRSAVAAAVVLAVAATFAGLQWRTAERQRNKADEQARLALSRELAMASSRQRESGDWSLALPLAIEAEKAAETRESLQALITETVRLSGVMVTLKHQDEVLYAAFSPDDQRVLTVSSGHTANIWDAQTGKSLTLPLGLAGDYETAAFGPDGPRVVTTTWDRATKEATVLIWNVETRKLQTPPLKHDSIISSVTFSPDGQRLATTTSWTDYEEAKFPIIKGSIIRIWDAQTGKPLTPPLKLEGGHRDFIFGPDGPRVITDTEDEATRSTVHIRDAQTGDPLGEPLKHGGIVNAAAFSPDGYRVVTVTRHTARIWDAQTGKPLTPPLKHEDYVDSAAFSPDGQRLVTVSSDQTDLVTVSSDQTAHIWNVETGTPVTPPLKHEVSVNSAAFSPDGRRLVTVSSDRTARIRSAQTGKPLTPPFRHERFINSAAFSHDGRRLLTASNDHSARIWDTETGKPLKLKHERYIESAVFSPDGRLVITASSDRTARIWDAETGKLLTPPLQHKSSVKGAAFSHNNQRVITATWDRTIRFWDAKTGQILTPRLKHEGSVTSAIFSPDDRRVITVSSDHTARIWDAETGAALTFPLKHEGFVASAIFDPDGQRVLTASSDHTARIWDAETGKPLTPPLKHDGPVSDAVFSPDGQRVVTTTTTPNGSRYVTTARIWDARTGAPLTSPLKRNLSLDTVNFSPDGHRLIAFGADARIWDVGTGEPQTPPLKLKDKVLDISGLFVILDGLADGTIRILDIQTGQPLTPPLHDLPARTADFSPDGRRVVTAGTDGIARIWKCEFCVSREELARFAKRHTVRRMNVEERMQFMHWNRDEANKAVFGQILRDLFFSGF